MYASCQSVSGKLLFLSSGANYMHQLCMTLCSNRKDAVAGCQVELEVTLPGEGRDRVFRVAIKFVAQVSLYALEEALEGRSQQIPIDAVQALDVVMRHMSSMT